MRSDSIKTKRVALNGILGAFAVICLVLATVLPTNRISLYALSSFFVAVSIIENGVKAGWIFYTATSLLTFILVPNKLGVIPYVIFFGIYGIAKYYIEKLDKIALEYVIKFIIFNISAGIAALTVMQLFSASMTMALPWYVLVIALEIVFFLYDFVYTLFIKYYREKLRKWVK